MPTQLVSNVEVHTNVYACTQTDRQTHPPTHRHTHRHRYTHTHTHTHTHNTHTQHIHTHTHTHIHTTHTYTPYNIGVSLNSSRATPQNVFDMVENMLNMLPIQSGENPIK